MANRTDPLLSVRGVTVRFGGIVVLDGVSFDVKRGDICGLIGPNGAGKTTLFNCLSRLYQYQAGDILFEGKSITHTPTHQIAGLGMGRFSFSSRDSPMTPLYEDDALLAVDKPAGLLAVPGRGDDKQDCLWQRVRERWPDTLVVHRLDMATSGLMLFARGAAVQRRLSRAFAARQVAKTYIAVVAGRMAAPSGRIELPLIADWPRRPLQKVDERQGKPSITDWRLIGFDAERQASRLALQPLTGRTHQLRVHLAAIGHPILGDALYAPPELQDGRLLLHAQALQFDHPFDGRLLQLRSEAPF